MACSKLFSGDLPELMNKIIQYFHYDYKTLHSCIFVNRLWCRLAIPLLWEDPFSIKFPKNYIFIEIYLNNLNDDDKVKLNEYIIHNKLFPLKTLFNYPRFIKHLDAYKVKQHSNYSIKNANLSLSQITKLIFGSLILLFIKNEANLHSFKVTTCIGYDNEIIELILQNQNLKKISFGYGYEYSLYHSLLSLNNLNCSNTLNTIIFYYINFKNINVLSEVFNQLNVLESIHIIYCYHLDSKFIQQINNIIKPFKLKSLFLNEMNYESLESLIQKSGNYLENFGGYHHGSQKLLQLIIKYCNKIKFLFPIWPNEQFIYLVFNIIENIKQNLNYLSIDLGYNTSSTILQNLGQILPFKLEYLNLRLNMINTNDLEFFLKNSQNIFIKKLLIKNTKNENCQNIFPYIKEYIMKRKRIKYLAIRETLCSKSEDLFFSKDKVMEFKLYGIQVLNYDDLVIDIYSFIIETY
ncbi:hypothetical protein RhiirB3_448043 [Rhizophagus irregularis]|nr:hypothetical protein RhiirB3_448043 [Rhizophagus irregularis]